MNMLDEYRKNKLLFHINKKTHSEWHGANFDQGVYSKICPYWNLRAPTCKRDLLLLYNFEYIFPMITFKKRCVLGTK